MPAHTQQKLSLFILTVFAVAGISVGIYQIYNYIYYRGSQDKRDVKSFSQIEEENKLHSIQAVMSLQNKDTDQDGLTDYDETYLYQTSPFLKDTDSDGITDKQELEQGSDPLCHKDKDCGVKDLIPLPSAEEEFKKQIPEYSDTGDSESDFKSLLPSQPLTDIGISAEQLRAMLVESGFTQDQLKAFSDSELLEMWQRVLEK